jgi:N-acetylglucosamine malate deacetylase 1
MDNLEKPVKPVKNEAVFPLDILAVGAHRDDVELMAGGTIIKMVEMGYKVGILDLTEGEMGTRGDQFTREAEAEKAAELMGVIHRENLKIPDTRVEPGYENRLKVIEVLRRLRPRVVIAPWTGHRHPDHNKAHELVTESCFFSGLRKYQVAGEPHRPEKIIYYLPFKIEIHPSFIVDISAQFQKKTEAIKCYHTQFVDVDEYLHLTPYLEGFLERIKNYNGILGRSAGVKYAEGFISKEPLILEDITTIRAKSY